MWLGIEVVPGRTPIDTQSDRCHLTRLDVNLQLHTSPTGLYLVDLAQLAAETLSKAEDRDAPAYHLCQTGCGPRAKLHVSTMKAGFCVPGRRNPRYPPELSLYRRSPECSSQARSCAAREPHLSRVEASCPRPTRTRHLPSRRSASVLPASRLCLGVTAWPM